MGRFSVKYDLDNRIFSETARGLYHGLSELLRLLDPVKITAFRRSDLSAILAVGSDEDSRV